MVIFCSIVSLFVLGSVAGWIIELFFRRFVSQHKWVNPGFLAGPYLPVYGFGVLFLYILSTLFGMVPKGSLPEWLAIILQIIIICISMTLIEFIAGLIFIKGLKIKLWDYSNRKGNIMGIICPTFSIIWGIVGTLYYFFIHPYLVEYLTLLASHTIYYIFVGIVLGMMIVDLAYSISLAGKIKKMVAKMETSERYERLRSATRAREIKTRQELDEIVNKIETSAKLKKEKRREAFRKIFNKKSD